MTVASGTILQLGGIALSVNVDTAVNAQRADTALKNVCRGKVGADPHPATAVKQSTACPTCKNDDKDTYEKAKQSGPARAPVFTIVPKETVAATKEDAVRPKKDIIHVSVHKAEEVDRQTIQGSLVYQLEPHKPGLAPLYAMLVDAIRRHPEYRFLGQWAPSSRVALFEFKLFGDTLVMEGRARTETLKIRQLADAGISQAEQGMVDMILNTLVTEYDPVTYEDKYKANLDALIEASESEEGIGAAKTERTLTSVPTGTVDLTAMLTAALGQAA